MLENFYKNPRYVLLMVMAISILALAIDLPKIPVKFSFWKFNIDTEVGGYNLQLKKGLDISGGVSVLLQADMAKIPEADKTEALDSLKNVIERRVNLLGISEAAVQTSRVGEDYRVIVELAGVFDTGQALSTIGEVAQLEFRVENIEATSPEIPNLAIPEFTPPEFVPTDLTGADLRKALVGFDNSGAVATGVPQIQLQFNAEGTKKFKTITEENLNKPVAIYLDDRLLIAPTVQSVIPSGQAVITGQFTLEEAQAIVAQLNAGALPVPVKVLEQKTVGPTLGQESVDKSVFAGMIGLSLVVIFMVLYYRRLGILASIALIIYGLVTLALYKIVPVVLTLPGIAGFILSIGMAVDANILIFERIKEELRADKPLSLALENGFGRSWDSIRDANLATLATTFILFNPFDWGFLPQSGPVRGFALTLALGIFISLFTGVFITRNLVRVFYRKQS